MSNPQKILDNQEIYGGRILLFQSLSSTNGWAMENIKYLQHRDVVWAVCQTEGKGRFDRKWISPNDSNLTVSVIIKYRKASELFTSTITQVAAILIAETLRKISLPAMVKWPNDVLVNGKKIAGILAERDQETGTIILGIGLNVNMTAEDLENHKLMQPATSIKVETGEDHVVGEVLKTLLMHLDKWLGFTSIDRYTFPTEEWDKIDFLKDKTITVFSGEKQTNGYYGGMDKAGRLIVTDQAGERYEFWSGDVSVRAND